MTTSLIILAAVVAAIFVIGGIFVTSMLITSRRSDRGGADASDSGYASPEGYSIVDGCSDGGGD